MTTILEVVQIAPYTSPNNFNCKVVTFEEIQIDETTGKETRTGNRASRCLIPDVPVTVIDNKVIKWKGDSNLNSISIGESYMGNIKNVNAISRTSHNRTTRSVVLFSDEKEVRATAMQLCYFQEYPLDIDSRPIYYARQLMANLNDNSDEEIEDYTESEALESLNDVIRRHYMHQGLGNSCPITFLIRQMKSFSSTCHTRNCCNA